MERRAHTRFQVSYKVLIPENGSYKETRTVDLSRSGMQIEVEGLDRFEVPEPTILIRVPGKLASLAVKAKVVWSKKIGDLVRMGFEFIHLGQSDNMLLDEVIHEAALV